MTDLRFLSAEWLAALGELVAAASFTSVGVTSGDAAAAPAAAAGAEAAARPLRLGQLVTGGPDGDVGYTVVVGGEEAGVLAGVEGAEVTLVETYGTAKALAAGELAAGDALARGLVKVRGNANLLIGAAPLLAGVAEAVAELRSRTSF